MTVPPRTELRRQTRTLLMQKCPSLTMWEADQLIDDAIPDFEEANEAPVAKVLGTYALMLDRCDRILLDWALDPTLDPIDRLRLARVREQILNAD